MNLLENNVLNEYLEQTIDPVSNLLSRIERETYLTKAQSHMLSGHYQGRLLSMISKMKSPHKILEIGTFTGYSALCLAEGLDRQKGELHTIDINDELEEQVTGYFESSEYKNNIHFHIGDAAEIIPTIPGLFDLVFIDADKKRNELYFELVLERTNPGAIILIDNILWKGKVFAEMQDKRTKEILNFNNKLATDHRIEKVLLPVRDGLFVLRKK